MAQERTGVITFQGNPLTLLGPELKVGDSAPEFSVVDGEFNPVKSAEFAGKVLLVSAVPSLDTPVCQLQTKRFNQEAEKLPRAVEVLTLSEDLPFAQGRFCGAEGISKVKVLSDHVSRDFGLSWGLLIKELSLLARAVAVVKGGKVLHLEVVPEITEHPDYDAALAAAREAAG